MGRTVIETPTAFIEDDIEDKFWKPEAWDKNLPSPGFVTDFVLNTRGHKAPTKFCAWVALYLISSMVKRDAWIQWSDSENFYANLFIILVAPPGICGKSTLIRHGTNHVLTKYHTLLENPVWQKIKELKIIRSKATREGLFKLMRTKKLFAVDNQKMKAVKKGGQVCLSISELQTFLGKQKYNIDLVGKLMDWYDCPTIDDQFTQSRGSERVEDVYLTLLAGTTEEGIKESVPPEALGDGFLSRTILIHEHNMVRKYLKMKQVTGGPSIEDIVERLAWLAENVRGEYVIAPEADRYYASWYKEFVKNLDRTTAGRLGRYSTHLLKTAFLLRIQRYERGNIITEQDFIEAQLMLDNTIGDSYELTKTLSQTRYGKFTSLVSGMISRRKHVQRKALLTSYSGQGLKARELDEILDQLIQEGKVVIKRNGCITTRVTKNGEELYIWQENQS